MCKEGLLTFRLEDATMGQRFRAEGVEEDLGKLWKRLRKNLEYLDLTKDMTQDRAQWHSKIHIADPTQ
ncbi:hypothetical protein ACFX1Z_008877 [Malus domestica]